MPCHNFCVFKTCGQNNQLHILQKQTFPLHNRGIEFCCWTILRWQCFSQASKLKLLFLKSFRFAHPNKLLKKDTNAVNPSEFWIHPKLTVLQAGLSGVKITYPERKKKKKKISRISKLLRTSAVLISLLNSYSLIATGLLQDVYRPRLAIVAMCLINFHFYNMHQHAWSVNSYCDVYYTLYLYTYSDEETTACTGLKKSPFLQDCCS